MKGALFGKSKARPPELVKSLRDGLIAMDKTPKTEKPNTEELSKVLITIKITLYGDNEHEPNQETVLSLANEFYSNDVLGPLLTNLSRFEFETKKDIVLIFNNLLRRQVGSRSPTVDYIYKNTSILEALVTGYEIADIALNCGAMLKECSRHESLTKIIVLSPNLWKFFKFVEVSNFDIASDAFATFKELLTKHKTLVAEFLEKNYDKFFEAYTGLLNSVNYVTKRQSLKLLGELLLDRANFNIMTKYISDQQNLKLMMTLLREKSRNIQFEAFHVFKVFVANPNKPQPILHILVKNKEKLVMFLQNFHNEKGGEDDQFNDEKAFLLKQIQQLPTKD